MEYDGSGEYAMGSRRELFVDGFLVDDLKGASLRLNHPVPKERAITFDMPWEGNTSAYVSVFRDGKRFRMYYRGSNYDWEEREEMHSVVCYAESPDGKAWTKPDLGLYEFGGSKSNNIVWTGVGTHNFAAFRDTKPGCAKEARYKALGGTIKEGGLMAFQSHDGIHWELMQTEPVITKGKLDSQNLALWDSVAGLYREYHRGSRDGFRDIMTSTSDDFLRWTEPRFLDFGDAPREHLYTNAVIPYFRAPHLLLGFPKRFLPKRKKVADHPLPGVSDGVLMSSRDGYHWHRWFEAFVRPGVQRERWWERNNMVAWGIVPTRGDIDEDQEEISLYANEGYYETGTGLRRHTIRLDGFVSLHTGDEFGEALTRILTFAGDELLINYSTSAAGSIKAEVTDKEGRPVPGFEMERCAEIYGDEIEGTVSWDSDRELRELCGKPVRLRFMMRDADLFSFRFV
jgi:hypothetical protein